MIPRNVIFNDDCMKLMESWIADEKNWFSVDLCITDPPYDVDYDRKSTDLARRAGGEQASPTRSSVIERDKHFDDSFERYDRFAKLLYLLMKNDSHVYIWCSEKQEPMWRHYMTLNKFAFCQILIWCKNSPSFDMTMGLKYAYSHELCLFFRKGTRKLHRWGQSTVYHAKKSAVMAHPTIKPLDIIMSQVAQSSDPGQLVFDPFMGSGTAAVSAKLLGRDYLGAEISPHFHALCLKRLKNESCERQSILSIT